jgi:transposase
MLGKACTYALNSKDRPMTFLLDSRIELSNEVAENAIRSFAVSRKNWLFAGFPKGVRASACVYSLVETAKVNCLDPLLYLKTLLENIRDSTTEPDPRP